MLPAAGGTPLYIFQEGTMKNRHAGIIPLPWASLLDTEDPMTLGLMKKDFKG
jgi:hypothetical protein